MNTARLDAIYSTLLAHCFRLNPEMITATQKRFGALEGKMVPPLVGDVELIEIAADLLQDHLKAQQHALGAWVCRKHHWPRCSICLQDVFPPAPETVAQCMQLAAMGHPQPRPISICSVPSEFGMLLACAHLARHFDLNGVPGFYQEPDRMPLPGAPDEEILIQQLKIQLRCPWRLNFPAQMMRSHRPTLDVRGENESLEVREGMMKVDRPAVLVPYDGGTGFIVGLLIYPTLRSKPFVLSSRGLPGGAAAVAYRDQNNGP